MAKFHGMNCVVAVDDSGGTLRTVTGDVDSVSWPRAADAVETTTFGTGVVNRSFIRGLHGSTISMSGKWDATATTGIDTVLSGLLTSASTSSVEVTIGTTPTAVKLSAEALLTSYEPGGAVEDAATWTAELQVTGAVTRTVS